MDDVHQAYQFPVDENRFKLVDVLWRNNRCLDVRVRVAAEVVLSDRTTSISNAIDLKMRKNDRGLVFEWKQPLILGWDWLTFSRPRSF
jgi:hypothetical protein